MSRHSASWSKIARAASCARTMSGPCAPVSSPMRNANVVPARLTTPFTSAVAVISRRSVWARMRSRNRSRTADGNARTSSGMKSGSSGRSDVEQLLFERDLGVREQHRELGRGEAEPGVVPVGELLVGRAAARRRGRDAPAASSACMNRACTSSISGACAAAVVERAVLAVVVAQHERRDLVGHD